MNWLSKETKKGKLTKIDATTREICTQFSTFPCTSILIIDFRNGGPFVRFTCDAGPVINVIMFIQVFARCTAGNWRKYTTCRWKINNMSMYERWLFAEATLKIKRLHYIYVYVYIYMVVIILAYVCVWIYPPQFAFEQLLLNLDCFSNTNFWRCKYSFWFWLITIINFRSSWNHRLTRLWWNYFQN